MKIPLSTKKPVGGILNSDDTYDPSKNKETHFLAGAAAADWSRWVVTRKFYAPAPGQPNILARNMPSRVGSAPDAMNAPDMIHYNRAINVLCDLAMSNPNPEKRRREIAEFTCFALYYSDQRSTTKQALRTFHQNLGYYIGTRTYYDHIARFSLRAYNMCQTLKKGSTELNQMIAPYMLSKAA